MQQAEAVPRLRLSRLAAETGGGAQDKGFLLAEAQHMAAAALQVRRGQKGLAQRVFKAAPQGVFVGIAGFAAQQFYVQTAAAGINGGNGVGQIDPGHPADTGFQGGVIILPQTQAGGKIPQDALQTLILLPHERLLGLLPGIGGPAPQKAAVGFVDGGTQLTGMQTTGGTVGRQIGLRKAAVLQKGLGQRGKGLPGGFVFPLPATVSGGAGAANAGACPAAQLGGVIGGVQLQVIQRQTQGGNGTGYGVQQLSAAGLRAGGSGHDGAGGSDAGFQLQ